MIRLKQTIGYVFLVAYVGLLAVVVAGATKRIQMETGPLIGLIAIGVTQTVTLLIAIVKAPHYFEDPPAMARLKEEISSLKTQIAERQTRHESQVAQLKADFQKEKTELVASYERKIRERDSQIVQLIGPTPNPGPRGSPIPPPR